MLGFRDERVPSSVSVVNIVPFDSVASKGKDCVTRAPGDESTPGVVVGASETTERDIELKERALLE